MQNLFVSLPTKEPLHNSSLEIKNCYNLAPIKMAKMYSAVETYITQNCCLFNNNTYRELKDLPMNFPLSPLLREIFTDYFENIMLTFLYVSA